MSDYESRFAGIARLYGQQEAVKIRQAHICVVGIGGVGSWAAEALARSGVGALTLIDMDDICISNVNRQLHALTSSVGQLKVEHMAERIRGINPECAVTIVDDFLTEETLADYLSTEFDAVLDAIDSANNKARLIAWCKRNKVPVVTTGAAGGQLDPTKISVVDLAKTTNDPLAAKVRSLLKRHYGFASSKGRKHFSVPCVYSVEALRYPQPDGSSCSQKSVMENGVRLDCSGGFGASTMVTASFGFTAAAKVLEKLAEKAG